MISACLSVESTELCRRVPERLVALSFDMSGAVFTQPVARQPLPNRLADEGSCKATEVDVVIRMSVQLSVCVCACVGLQAGATAALHGALQGAAPFPVIAPTLPNMAMADSRKSLIRSIKIGSYCICSFFLTLLR